ncbi:hypothetical protein HanXRQr2_Chr17g0792401 [Helianthus annuus]|uniref:Uncharacterized protein n=1 Tax=Helianthus annuus TaxID=4232 RepID=A0A9K3DFG3_HELAN|nr:hypothetical protein HanXRQr2_Chr17g0792401 [Helianthus annuus]KAJ0812289.1 hypothetical protein HanPSC8_Chr17g0760351 [Helianthus annuus]
MTSAVMDEIKESWWATKMLKIRSIRSTNWAASVGSILARLCCQLVLGPFCCIVFSFCFVSSTVMSSNSISDKLLSSLIEKSAGSVTSTRPHLSTASPQVSLTLCTCRFLHFAKL